MAGSPLPGVLTLLSLSNPVNVTQEFAWILLQFPPEGGVTITGVSSILIKISQLALHKKKGENQALQMDLTSES